MRTLLPLALALSVTFGCDRAGDDPQVQVQDPVGGVTDRIDIPARVRGNIGITFTTVDQRRVADTVRVPGSFELQPLARHEYRMMLPGRIEFLVSQYQEVRPGTPLFRSRSPRRRAWPRSA